MSNLTGRSHAECQKIESLQNNVGRPRARQALRNGLRGVALIALGLGLGLAVAEVALRALDLGQPGLYTYDRDRGWALRPNASKWQQQEGSAYVAVNSAGLRDRDHPYRKPKNTFRIAVLGDSFTEAKQVPADQTFCAVIARRLRELSGACG